MRKSSGAPDESINAKKLERRDFLKAGGAMLAGAALLPELNSPRASVEASTNPAALPSVSAASSAAASSSRRIFPLNRNWRYSDKAIAGATAPEFDDRKFARVTIPHTNRVLPWHSFDDKDYQFVSIYRRRFKLPSELRRTGQRIFVDFDGVMTAAVVTINGEQLGEYKGGYTPFSFEITRYAKADNVLAVEVDSTERADIPPFGGKIDYLTFGGIYRDVRVRVVPNTFIENVFAKPVDVMSNARRLDVRVFLDGKAITSSAPLKLTAELRDGNRLIASATANTATKEAASFVDLSLTNPGAIELWKLDRPKLYDVTVRLANDDHVIDEYATRTGFRDARFTPDGFMLNGEHIKLRGLNRHQTFPFVGQAMPARVQRRDALILKRELKCNIVRTSHYPQSPHFLDACDDIGLLVLEEIPGWQHIGDQAWKDLAVRNVEKMIRRDWNHPSIILWGVRINESADDHDFYTQTNKTAHALDDSRQTGGIRNKPNSELLEEVYTVNDFGFPLREPNHPLYLNTEFIGHTYPTKTIDNTERTMEHTLRHARIHNQLGSKNQYAGGIGWCAFDYNTHNEFGSGDRVCYHGVSDIFRLPKLAAGFYKSQCDTKDEIVLEPAFHWTRGDRAAGGTVSGGTPNQTMFCSNCDHLKIYINDELKAEVDPDTKNFGGLAHPPFFADNLRKNGDKWGDLRVEGYLKGVKVITKQMSFKGVDREFHVEPDDTELFGDGIDATRIVLRVTDEYGMPRPFSSGAVSLDIEGAGEIIGDNPFALVGGCGAVWVKAKEAAGGGTIRLSARHTVLGTKQIEMRVKAVAPEAL